MDEKKRDDYTIKMPDLEMRNLNGRSSPLARSSRPSGLPIPSQITNNPAISILAYCLASISMTVINKYCVSGEHWNLNLFFLAFQVCLSHSLCWHVADNAKSIICIIAIMACKSLGLIKDLAKFDSGKAKKCMAETRNQKSDYY